MALDVGIRSRHWAFTFFPDPETDDMWVDTDTYTCDDTFNMELESWAKGYVWQREAAPLTGNIHLQGHAIFKNLVGLSWLKERMNRRIHWKAKFNNDVKPSIEYCRKKETRVDGPYHWGCLGPNDYVEKMGKQGHRSDLTNLAQLINDGKDLQYIYENETVNCIKYANNIKTLVQHKEISKNSGIRDLDVELSIGKPGLGKTWDVYALNDPNDVFTKSAQDKWFDGYNGQSLLLLDDFDDYWSLQAAKNIMDPYPCTVQTKGGTVAARWTKIVITSNFPPEQWFTNHKIYNRTHRLAIERRIGTIKWYNGAQGEYTAFTGFDRWNEFNGQYFAL